MNKQSGVIILAIFSLQGGGAERFVITLAEGFRKVGYEPHIICFKSQIDYVLPDTFFILPILQVATKKNSKSYFFESF